MDVNCSSVVLVLVGFLCVRVISEFSVLKRKCGLSLLLMVDSLVLVRVFLVWVVVIVVECVVCDCSIVVKVVVSVV